MGVTRFAKTLPLLNNYCSAMMGHFRRMFGQPVPNFGLSTHADTGNSGLFPAQQNDPVPGRIYNPSIKQSFDDYGENFHFNSHNLNFATGENGIFKMYSPVDGWPLLDKAPRYIHSTHSALILVCRIKQLEHVSVIFSSVWNNKANGKIHRDIWGKKIRSD